MDDLASTLLHDMILRSALLVGATEAAGFRVSSEQTDRTVLEPLVHIRPGKASTEVREAAVEAFKEMILRCVANDKRYGAMTISGTRDETGDQFCLVRLIPTNGKAPVAATAFIRRCRDAEEARAQLAIINGRASPLGPLLSSTTEAARVS